jgi:ubiquinone/menaquinone biosynthesis C-methylase UbiE
MLAIARQRAAAIGRDVDFREGDAQRLPFDDAAFDTVVCAWPCARFPTPPPRSAR